MDRKPADNAQMLRDAIGRNGGCVVSLPSAMGVLAHSKSRFLADDEKGFWVESGRADRELVDQMVGSRRQAGFSFKAGNTKVVFASTILRWEPAYAVNATFTVQAMLVEWPAEIRAIQRRANYRATVVADSDLTVRVWRIGRTAYLTDRPASSQEISARLRDISTGGVGVVFLSQEEPPRITPEDRLRIQLNLPDGGEMLLEGRLRYPIKVPKDAKDVRAGIQFKQMNDDMADRQMLATLTKLVGEMQRAEARRFRLGIA